MLRLAIGRPSCVRRISGSSPRFPTRITLFTLPAIAALHSKITGTGRPLAIGQPTAPLASASPKHGTSTLYARGSPIAAIPRHARGYPHIASPGAQCSSFVLRNTAGTLRPGGIAADSRADGPAARRSDPGARRDSSKQIINLPCAALGPRVLHLGDGISGESAYDLPSNGGGARVWTKRFGTNAKRTRTGESNDEEVFAGYGRSGCLGCGSGCRC